jgi:DNA (cytosine-5)-methyltransferase 1
MNSPDPRQVIKLRESIQQRDGLGITAAQDLCAEMLHTSRRSWQQWERGERKMHPAFWELAQYKTRVNLESKKPG